MLTDKWIEEQLQICEAASQGPWHDGFDDGSGRVDEHDGAYITFGEIDRFGMPQYIVDAGGDGWPPTGVIRQEDVDFIIAAREGYVKVLMALKSLHEEMNPIAECPCCGESYLERQGLDGLCPECNSRNFIV